MKTIELRDYQKEAVEAISHNSKGIIVAATGSGKTTMMSQAIKEQYNNNKILILVHLKTLVEQTRKRMEDETGLKVASFYGDQRDYFSENDVIVSTWQSMQLIIKSNFISPAYFEHIHVDECHNARNSAYRKVINFFHPDTLHGYTATLDGNGKEKIVDVFGEVVYDIGLFDLIRRGYLSKMKVMIHINEMDNLKHNQTYNEKKFEVINEMTRKNGTTTKALHFYSRNKRFNEVHEWNLLKTGSYANVSGMTKRADRQSIFKVFQNEESGLNHILSNRVLNEGVDLPIANTIIFHETIGDFRIVTQRIGRGLRIYKGQDTTTQVLFFLESNQYDDINNILYFIDEVEREKEKHGVKNGSGVVKSKKAKKHGADPTDEVPITITMIDKTSDFLDRFRSSKHIDTDEFTLDDFVQQMRADGITSGNQYNKVYRNYNFGSHPSRKLGMTAGELWGKVREFTLDDFVQQMRAEGITSSVQYGKVWRNYNFTSAPQYRFGMTATELWKKVRGGQGYTLDEFVQQMRADGITSANQYFKVWRDYNFTSIPHTKLGMTVKELWDKVREGQGYTYTLDEFVQQMRADGITSGTQYYKVWRNYNFSSAPQVKFGMSIKELWGKVNEYETA